MAASDLPARFYVPVIRSLPSLPLGHCCSPSIHHLLTFTTFPGQLLGHAWRVTNITSAAPSKPRILVQYEASLASADFHLCSTALIIHAAESHSHRRDRQTGPSALLSLYKILSVRLYDTISFPNGRLAQMTAGLTKQSSEVCNRSNCGVTCVKSQKFSMRRIFQGRTRQK